MYKKNGIAIDFYQKRLSALRLRHLKIKKRLIFFNVI